MSLVISAHTLASGLALQALASGGRTSQATATATATAASVSVLFDAPSTSSSSTAPPPLKKRCTGRSTLLQQSAS